MIATTLRGMLDRDPFVPFLIRTSGGESYTVPDPHLVALLKSEVFIAAPNSDRRTHLPYLHIAAVETLESAAASRKSSRRRKPPR